MPLKRFPLYLSIFFVSIATFYASTTKAQSQKPKNIILMIADGTGLNQISAMQFYNSQPSNYDRFKTIGLIKTSSASSLITDSAAGGTAFSTGTKTYNGAIAVDTDTIAVPTILEDLEKREFSTGLIATSTITHATPASFYAHQKLRKMELEIAEDLVTSDLEFFAGGGRAYFENREDGNNLVAKLEGLGYEMQLDRLDPSQKMSKKKKYGYLLAQRGMPRLIDGRGSFLYDATKLGIRKLSQNKKGFFLMIEGSQVDWGGHANDSEYLISELIDFDSVMGQVLDFAEKDGNTLVIVTADHETGGFSLSSENSNYNKIQPTFSTTGHSATMVPVFAYGPGASIFSGVYENTEIYTKMKELLSE